MGDAVTKLRQPRATFGENGMIVKNLHLFEIIVRTDVKICFFFCNFLIFFLLETSLNRTLQPFMFSEMFYQVANSVF